MKTLSQIREASGDKAAYQKFVNTMLKKFGVKSPAELEGDKKKEFYDALDAGWEGDNEEPEAGDKKESAVAENCGADHSGKGKCPECGKQLTEGKLDAEIEMLAWVRDAVHNSKGNTKHNKLKQAFIKMFGNAAAKKHWDDMVTIAMDESVELEEARSGYVGTISGGNSIAIKIDGIDDGEARLGTRNGMKAIDAFKKTAKKTYADAKGKKTIPAVKKAIKMQGATQYYAKWKSDSASYKDDSVEIWYTKSVKESVEIDEGVSLAKKGNYELTADGKSAVGVQMAIRYKGKMLYPVTRSNKKFVVAFPKGWMDKNFDKYDTSMVIFTSKGKYERVEFDNANDVIKFFSTKNIKEAVNVDMRTKGYKEAIARGFLRASKRAKKTEIEKILTDANKAMLGKNEDMTAGGSDATGEIAGKDMPMKKKMLKRFRDA